MSHYVIRGGRPLRGCIPVSGAKNSVLPILAATLLTGGKSVLHNCPDLRDVRSAIAILEYLGCKVTVNDLLAMATVKMRFHTFCLP